MHDPSHCLPLQSRIDPLMRSNSALDLKCSLSIVDGSQHSLLGAPLFTRATHDAMLTPSSQERLIVELHQSGIGWLSGRKTDLRLSKQLVLASGADSSKARPSRRIVPINLDEPVDVESLEQAVAIELQLYGQPFQSLPASRRARWTPNLPIEVAESPQLAKKIEGLRLMSLGNSAIGAAISPGAVYDDVRWLADCGFDYFCLMIDIQYELSSQGTLALAPLQASVEQALRGLKDSGAKTKLLLSANLRTAEEMFRWLQMGVHAICVDAYLAMNRPQEVAPPKDTYGSVLSYAMPQASTYAWVRTALSKLMLELSDCKAYCDGS
jgi:hypothetical protein